MNFCFKYKDYKTIQNSDVLKGKIIDKYKKQKKYIPDKIENVDFVNKISVQSDKLLFTNKFQRRSSQRVLNIRNLVHELQKNPNSIKYYFDGRDLECRTKFDIKKLERLSEILKLNKVHPNGALVSKYVPNNNYYRDFNLGEYERGFQLILSYNNGYIRVYLIDLYHLAIQSKDNNFREEYSIRKKYNKCLSETIFNNENINSEKYTDKENTILI